MNTFSLKRGYSIVIMMVVILLTQSNANGSTIYLDPSDNISAELGSAGGGDTVIFSPGTYNKVLLQNRNFTEAAPLILKSDGTGDVIFSTVNYTGTGFKFVNSSYIVLQGVIVNGGLNAVVIEGGDHIIVRDCEIRNPGQAGVHIHYSATDIDIIGNHIHHTGTTNPQWGEGIYVGTGSYSYTTFPDNCENVWIEGNELHDCGNGEAINVKGESFHVTVKDNVVYDIAPGTATQYNQAAITLEAASVSITEEYRLDEWRDIWVTGNEVYNVSGGYDGFSSDNGIMFGGVGSYIVGNTVHRCDETGIRGNAYKAIDSLDTYVYNNTTFNNGANAYYGGLTVYTSDPGSNPNSPQDWYMVPEVSVTSVVLDTAAILIPLGMEYQLIDYVYPYIADDRSVSWSSSDTSVVTVTGSGLIIPAGEGSAIITVTTTEGSFTADCSVIVNDGLSPIGEIEVFDSLSTDGGRSAVPYFVQGEGSVESISIYHEGGSGNFILAIYDGDSAPDTLLATTAVTALDTSAGWQTVDLSASLNVYTADTIWLAWSFQTNPGIRYTSGTPGIYSSGSSWNGAMPTSFGSGTQSDAIYSLFASYDPVNVAPSIAFSSHSDGDTIVVDPGLALIAIEAEASDSDGSISQVQFFVDDSSIGTVTSDPYAIDWTNVTAGSYTLSAIVTDDESATDTTSIAIVVAEYVNPPGTVGVTQILSTNTTNNKRRAQPFEMPENGFIESLSMYHFAGSGDMILAIYDGVSAPNNLLAKTATTAVTNADGWQTIGLLDTVAVEAGETIWLAWVYETNPGIKYQTGSNGRFDSNVAWVGGMPSTFGSGTQGSAVYSLYANYTVNTAPDAEITSPPNATTYTAPADISITASASDADGSIIQVEFFHDSTSIGVDSVAPYSITWEDVAIGTYSIIAVATDDSLNTTVSDTVSVIVQSDSLVEATIGYTTRLASATNNAKRRAVPLTMTESGTIESLTMYHRASTGNMILAVYEGDSVPTNRIAVTPTTAVSGSDGWQEIDLISPVSVTSGKQIWLAWVFENSTNIYYESGTPGRFDSGETWSGGMPSTFGSGSQGSAIYSIYATYTTSTSRVGFEGERAIAVQSGITAMAYPNPMNTETTIAYSLSEDSQVSIEIVGVNGQLIERLISQNQHAGDHEVVWNPGKSEHQTKGLVFYRLAVKTHNNTYYKVGKLIIN